VSFFECVLNITYYRSEVKGLPIPEESGDLLNPPASILAGLEVSLDDFVGPGVKDCPAAVSGQGVRIGNDDEFG
jgi:hypothetical protein